jgi:hypothetical protein
MNEIKNVMRKIERKKRRKEGRKKEDRRIGYWKAELIFVVGFVGRARQ